MMKMKMGNKKVGGVSGQGLKMNIIEHGAMMPEVWAYDGAFVHHRE